MARVKAAGDRRENEHLECSNTEEASEASSSLRREAASPCRIKTIGCADHRGYSYHDQEKKCYRDHREDLYTLFFKFSEKLFFNNTMYLNDSFATFVDNGNKDAVK